MLEYKPFDCEFHEINEEKLDLLIKKGSAESWYIEFKEFLVTDSKKLAKSISSFANSEGGWYFVGVKSDPKTNAALEICGFDSSLEIDLADRLSKIIISNISPVPDFEIKIVALKNQKTVVIIKVEDGIEPPYITSSGTIHQREHNSNNPVTDRYIIEKMYEKARMNHNRIEKFSCMDYGETKGQSDGDQAYLELYLFPIPFNSFSFKNFFESSFFNSVANKFFGGVNFTFQSGDEEHQTGLGLNFNAIYSSFDSLIIRPINDQTIVYKGTTVELYRNGNIKILLPLYCFKLDSIPKQYKDSSTIEYLLNRFSPFEEKIEHLDYPFNNNFSNKTISRKESDFNLWFQLIDGHELLLVLVYLVNTYGAILKENSYDKGKLGFRAKITNAWRKIIFLDNEPFLDAIKKYNIPATPKADIEIPNFHNGKHLTFDINEYTFLEIYEFLLEGIGIPRNEEMNYSDILKKSINILKVKDI